MDHDAAWWQGERHRTCMRCRAMLPDADAIVWATVVVLLEAGGRELDRRYRSRATRAFCSPGCASAHLGWTKEAPRPYTGTDKMTPDSTGS